MRDTLIRFSLINTVAFLSTSLKSAGMFEDEDTALPNCKPSDVNQASKNDENC